MRLLRPLWELVRTGRGAHHEPYRLGNGVVGIRNLFVELYAVDALEGVLLFDTGMDPRGRPVDALLHEIGRTRSDVRHVFLTHAHPDHVAGAPLFDRSAIHIGAADEDRLAGRAAPRRRAERVFRRFFPTPPTRPTHRHLGQVVIDVGGGESVIGFPMPGDTMGAYAWLIRGMLFVGDGMDLVAGRLEPTPPLAADDTDLNRQSIVALERSVADHDLRRICTCHGGPTPIGLASELLHELSERMKQEGA